MAALQFVRNQAAFNRTMPECWPYFRITWTWEDDAMKLTSWGVLAFVGSLIFLLLLIKDWETKMEGEKRSRKLPHHSGLNADPNLMLVSERGAYMRTRAPSII